MKPISTRILFSSTLLSLLVSGCQLNQESESLVISDTNGQSGLSTESHLQAVTSDAQLEQHLKQGYINSSNIPTMESGTIQSSDMADSSGTNLQVDGVDEADLVKHDGQYLYSINHQKYSYSTPSIVASPSKTTTISVSQIQANPAASHLLTEIKINTDNASATLNGLYLTTDKDGKGEQLIATGNTGQVSEYWYNPWSWQSGQTKVWIYDVSEASAPQQSHNISIDGYLISSRRVENTLYLVTRFTPNIEGYRRFPSTDDDITTNQTLLEQTSLNELLPTISVNNSEPQPILQSQNCFVPESTETNNGYPILTSITAINLNSPEDRVSACYSGSANGIYASTKNIYLTAATNKDSDSNDFDERSFSSNTLIHKFAMTNNKPSYQGSAVVAGHMSVSGGRPNFLMGERNEVLHIVTSQYKNYRWQHQLTNLQSDADKTKLEIIAQLPNKEQPGSIGKPGEQIYAVRYIDDRAYVVTYKKVDPLYIIDLSDNNNPVIAGELEIPGYSSYLHPINDRLLLGIGKEALADERGNFAWYQGLKVSLFDVSDINAPKEINNISLGERGSNSPVLYNHHSLSYLAGSNGIDKFSIPISLHQGGEQTYPWEWADWQHDGLYLFEIDTNNSTTKLTHSGTMIAEQASSTNTQSPGIYHDRSVIQDSAAHYLHDNKLTSADWVSVTP